MVSGLLSEKTLRTQEVVLRAASTMMFMWGVQEFNTIKLSILITKFN